MPPWSTQAFTSICLLLQPLRVGRLAGMSRAWFGARPADTLLHCQAPHAGFFQRDHEDARGAAVRRRLQGVRTRREEVFVLEGESGSGAGGFCGEAGTPSTGMAQDCSSRAHAAEGTSDMQPVLPGRQFALECPLQAAHLEQLLKLAVQHVGGRWAAHRMCLCGHGVLTLHHCIRHTPTCVPHRACDLI